MLWNPLTKKTARFRPEERVRLQLLDYLILKSDIPASRISIESPVPTRYSNGRTDILCYDTRFSPYLLVECKAESVSPGSKAATQSATYNRFLKAPYIMLTNGVQETLYKVSASLDPLTFDQYPVELRNTVPIFDATIEYWKIRGFLPKKIPDFIASPFAYRLALLFHASDDTKSYLNIAFPTDRMSLSHYYVLIPAPGHPDTLIAFTLRSVNQNQMILCAIGNKNKRNTSCLRIQISELGEFYNPELYLADSKKIIAPDVAHLEAIWNSLDNLVHPAKYNGKKQSELTDSSLGFTDKLTAALESIFFTVQSD